MSGPVIDLAEAGEQSVERVGGKARHLGLMHGLGLPVPPGFVIDALALSDGLSDELWRRIVEETRRRGWDATPLAVRSSAPQEDSAHASFAGIHDSVLNVEGLPALADAIRQVLASLHSPRAQAYRQRFGVEHASMAVVVMPMLAAEAAGVIFTCHPQSGRDDHMVVNAVHGLADGLVSGAVSGEELVLAEDRHSERLRVLSRSASAPDAPPVLSDARAEQLGLLARDAAQALDYSDPSYDLEWVDDGRDLWLVQARPITARPWYTYAGLAGQDAIWSNGNTRDVVPHVMQAMDWINWRRLVDVMLEHGYRLSGFAPLEGIRRSALLHGRLYLNAALLQWEAFDAFGIAPAAINAMLGGHHPEIGVPPAGWKTRLRRGLGLIRYILRAPRERKAGRRQIAQAFARTAQWRSEDPTSWDNALLAERLRTLTGTIRSQGAMMFLQGSGGGNLHLLLELVGTVLPRDRHALVSAIMAGGEPSITARQAHDLHALARKAGFDHEARRFLQAGPPWDLTRLPERHPFRTGFRDFLERYGHRGIYESYLPRPRFRESPAYLLDSAARLMDVDPAICERQCREASRAAWKRLGEAMSPIKLLRTRLLLAAARGETRDRELARSALMAYSEVLRLWMLEAGRRLDLPDGAGIFHLTPHEVQAGLAGRISKGTLTARIAHRMGQVQRWDRDDAPEVIIGRQARSTPVCGQDEDGAWTGIAVGSGLAEGAARVVMSPEQAGPLNKGDILVAPSTDPAWTPLFLMAGGLVMETGGFLSHGAIVAREFGIPAVANLPGVLGMIRDGQGLRVDGDAGKVWLLEDR